MTTSKREQRHMIEAHRMIRIMANYRLKACISSQPQSSPYGCGLGAWDRRALSAASSNSSCSLTGKLNASSFASMLVTFVSTSILLWICRDVRCRRSELIGNLSAVESWALCNSPWLLQMLQVFFCPFCCPYQKSWQKYRICFNCLEGNRTCTFSPNISSKT